MVVQSGQYPYAYHPSSWASAQSGTFRIPAGQLVQPSAIHFEEAMYVLKHEFNRVLLKQSGYKNVGGQPQWWTLKSGKFYSFLNNIQSGAFSPDPSGKFLGGERALNHISDEGSIFGALIPGAVHQRANITLMRQLWDFILENGYGAKGGGWSVIGDATQAALAAKRDWLGTYKGYDDTHQQSGVYFQGENPFLSGLIFDRHLDEVRVHPMPYFGLAGDLNAVHLVHDEPWGLKKKYEKWHLPPLRPRYIKTDGTFPAGWTSGIEIGYNTSVSPGTGIGGFLVDGTVITLSGGGAGLENNMVTLTGTYAGGLDNETFGAAVSYCNFTNVSLMPGPDWRASPNIPTGQYKVILAHSGQEQSFPWGLSGTPHRSAVWPWDGFYEPVSGVYNRPDDDMFDTDAHNSSFFVTDHAFIYQHDWALHNETPRYESGIYWYQTNSGPSHSAAVIDGWPMRFVPSGGYVGTAMYTSGINALWGLCKWEETRTQNPDAGIPQDVTQWIYGSAFVYDRANNYYLKMGGSGLSTPRSNVQASGVYARFKQQMTFVDGGIIGPQKSFGGINWHIGGVNNGAWNGSEWVFNAGAISGLDNPPLAVKNHTAWVRTDTSFAIQDGLIENEGFVGGTVDLGWLHYGRNAGEYLSLSKSRDGNEVHGVAGSKYKTITSITWGTLGNTDATGSGVYTATEYTMSYAAGMDAVLNLGATPASRIHIIDFFDKEPDDELHCLLMAFPSGVTGNTSDDSSLFIAAIDDSSHPYEVTGCWRLHGAGTSYSNAIAGNGFATVDGGGCMDHMEIHVTE